MRPKASEKPATDLPLIPLSEFDPWAFERTPMPREYKVFTDSKGRKIGLTLMALGAVETAAGLQSSAKLIEEFCDEDGNAKPGDPFLGPNGEEYQIGSLAFKDACLLRAAQPEEERKPILWWIGLMVTCDELYGQISDFAGELSKRARGNSKRATRTTSTPE